ncbi:MAG: 3-deoxy-manno-octulosonate cytidylyltransferase [Nitrospiraceae bacterium]|nr:MAG: 3-deoxy-manno-octulosonate cytidylyltransferase [Nitrospiraceae bacterium]
MHRVAAIIPARFHATRFPGKPLALLRGKPLIQHVYEQAVKAGRVDSVFVATDDERIYDTVSRFGGRAVMTSTVHESGTDRIAEAAARIDCEYVINVQGDEPFIEPEMIDDVVDLLYNDDRAEMGTLAKRITGTDELLSPHVVKVVFDEEGFALYFSRAPIPFHRDDWKDLQGVAFKEGRTAVFKHIGIYGFRKEALSRFSSLKKGRLEDVEKLEQLRALNAGMKIKVKETTYDTFGIDTVEDLRKAEEWQNISL